VPLILEGQPLGAVLAGQVFNQYPEQAVLERIAKQLDLPPSRVWQQARLEYPVKQDTLRVYADLLAHLSQTFLQTRYATLQEAERLSAMQRLQETSTRLISEGRIDTLLGELLSAVLAVTHADRGTLQLLDSDTGELRLQTWQGVDRSFVAFFERVQVPCASACGAALQTGRRVVVSDMAASELIAADPSSAEVFRRAGIRALQSTPLLSRSGRLLGLLSSYWNRPYQPAVHELHLLDVLARQAADLIESSEAEEALQALHTALEQAHNDLSREMREQQHATLGAHIRVRQRLEAQLRQTQKMEALGTLAGGIAHEFNNILAGLLGFATMLHREVPPKSRAGFYVQQVHQAGTRAKELVQQILTFSRAESLERQPLALDQVVQEALTLLRASLPSTVDIQYHVSEPGVMVQANRTQLHEVIMNLGANADHAMRESGGRLTVRVDPVEVDAAFATAHPPLSPGRHVCLMVDDTGRGMPPEVIGRIFEPFFTTKPTGAGAGMGLAIVHGIITSHEGVVTVESSQGAGTRFAIYLPAVDPSVTQVAAPELPVPQGKGRVLLVDDEETVALAMRFLLESLGYDVVVHTSSRDALEAFRTNPDRFDVVITDQTMPQMTGEDFIHALHRLRPELPVILCTGFSHVMDAKKAQTLGQVTFLMKPVDEYELGVLLQQLLVRRSKFP
jgi:signal transduction histidine kinase/ActR/RegA family two-component response regulator